MADLPINSRRSEPRLSDDTQSRASVDLQHDCTEKQSWGMNDGSRTLRLTERDWKIPCNRNN